MASSAARKVKRPLEARLVAHRDETCIACHDSGDIWVLDRQAGAVRISCGCGAAHAPDSDLRRLAMVACHGITIGVTVLVVFLTL